MANISYFQAQDLIKDAVKDLFHKDMIFVGVDINSLSNEDFTKKDNPDEGVGLIIQQAGYKVDPLRGKRSYNQQQFKYFWRLAIVCPADDYMTLGGSKHTEVVARLMGMKLSVDFTETNWIDDERDFNEPELVKDLMFIPMMLEVKAVITGDTQNGRL